MAMFWSFFLVCLSGYAASFPSPQASSTAAANPSLPTICGDIVQDNIQNGDTLFYASDVFDCLSSVPFNAAIAARLLQYYNDTVQFQSTLTYLKAPPPGYQQPPVDLVGGLSTLLDQVNNGTFGNQYAFEAALQILIYQAHDLHFDLLAGTLAAFTFLNPFSIVSVSLDGIQQPKVYISDDILAMQFDSTYQPSAIARINDQSASDYLSRFAAVNAIGGNEPHADWNQLMASPALYVQNDFPVWEGLTTFYPGDNMTYTFENGTTSDPVPWLAQYKSPGDTGPLETGGDFYNFFVLGFYPASFNANTAAADSNPGTNSTTSPSAELASFTDAASSTDSATPDVSAAGTAAVESPLPRPTGWGLYADATTTPPNLGYPEVADVVQPDLLSGGFLTGYFLRDYAMGVLSIPTFFMPDLESIANFTATVSDFLSKSKEAGMTRILIDVQQNVGGDTLLAYDTFKQFFPQIDPFGASQMRAHPYADALGTTLNGYFQNNAQTLNNSFFDYLDGSEWVVTDRLDATTGQNFSSWANFFGPQGQNGDLFTKAQRYDFSNSAFDASFNNFQVYGFASRPATSPQPYDAEDMVILSDGQCASTCALFVELMHHEAGVRTVAVGGRPSDGPMQTTSSRGAALYSRFDLNDDISVASSVNATASPTLPSRGEDVFIFGESFNLRDQVRKGEDIPTQFLYDAADCRIYYTPQSVFNYTNLWKHAAVAIFSNSSFCVKGSTGFSTTSSSSMSPPPPPQAPSSGITLSTLQTVNSITGFDPATILAPGSNLNSNQPPLQARENPAPLGSPGSPCRSANDCSRSAPSCQVVPTCGGGALCVVPCTNNAFSPSSIGGRKCVRNSPIRYVTVQVGGPRGARTPIRTTARALPLPKSPPPRPAAAPKSPNPSSSSRSIFNTNPSRPSFQKVAEFSGFIQPSCQGAGLLTVTTGPESAPPAQDNGREGSRSKSKDEWLEDGSMRAIVQAGMAGP